MSARTVRMSAQDHDRKRISASNWDAPSIGTLSIPSAGEVVDVAFDDDRFHVVREIARGGMGRILAATDRRLGRPVAIKVALANDTTTQQRLGREAAILSSLVHPALPQIYELGRLRSGNAYFATRLVDGETLESWLRQKDRPWRSLLPLLAELADVMHQVHQQGVIHRDLKPSNILIQNGGSNVVIVDWGIAVRTRPLDFDAGPEAMHDLDLTMPGTAIGTPGYWAPEQQRGEPGDVTSDVYSLGAIMFRVVAGKAARSGVPTGALLEDALPSSPRWLGKLIAKATALEPEDRHPSMAAFASELRRGIAKRASRERGVSRHARRGVLVASAAFALLVHDSTRATGTTDANPIVAMLTSHGHWDGTFGEMAFSVANDHVHVRAVYAHDHGAFVGRIVDDKLVGHWCEMPYATDRDTGDATFSVDLTGIEPRLDGIYHYANGDAGLGRWELWHFDSDAPPELAVRLKSERWRCGPLSAN